MASDFISELQAAQQADAAAPPPPSGGDFLSELSAAQKADAAAPVSTTADAAKSFGQGLISGTEGLAGLPGDVESLGKRAMNWATSPIDYGMLWAQGWAAQKAGALPSGETPSSFATSKLEQLNATRGATANDTTADVAQKAQSVGVPDYQPQTTAGQYAKTFGSFVPGAMTMPADSPAGVAGNVAKYALAPGVASEAAGQAMSGTSWEPYARTAGALLGGVGSDLTVAGTRQAINAGKAFAEPMTAAGQQAIAARKLAGTFTDPDMAKAVLEESDAARQPGAAIGENVPGSKPTTGQLTGDMGALSLERELATRNPELAKTNPFGTGSEQQNAARSSALNAIQPTGSPEEVGNLVRQQMAQIQAEEDAKVAAATQGAQNAGLGASDALTGQASALDASHNAAIGQARQTAQNAAAGIGGGATPEAQGDALRSTLQAARDAAKARERSLWQAVDPDGTLALPASPVIDAASNIAKSLPTTAKPMAGEEAAIFGTAAHLPQVAPFSDVTALRSRISTAMRQELIQNGQSPTYARLTQLRGSVEDAISNAVENQAAAEQRAVAAGQLSPSQTFEARWKADADAFQAARAKAAAGSYVGQGDLGYPGSGSPSVRGLNGTEIQGGGGSGDASGTQGLPLTPNLDEAAAQRLRAASAATRERASTFDQGPVGTVLKKAGTASDYKTPDSAVPGKLFVKGPGGAQTVQAYAKAAGDAGTPALENAAAESLRRAATNAEGHIDPTRFARWRFEHQDALRALPQSLQDRFANAAVATDRLNELTTARDMAVEPLQGAAQSLTREVMDANGVIDPAKFARWQNRHREAIDRLPANVRDQLSTASRASEAIGHAADARKQAIDAYQKSAAGKFLGISSPEDVTKTVAGIFGTKTAGRDMAALARRVASNPDAKEGLRKAVADVILSKAKGTTEAGASGVENLNASTLQKFLRDNHATIKAAGFSDRELGSMQAIAADMQRSQRTLQATRLPGQSNTAQDIIKAIDAGNAAHPTSLLTKIARGGEAGWVAHGPHGAALGAAAALGQHVIAGFRNAGLAKANALVRDAILNPELAKALLQQASRIPNRGSETTLAKLLARSSMFTAVRAAQSGTSENASNMGGSTPSDPEENSPARRALLQRLLYSPPTRSAEESFGERKARPR